MGHHSTCRTCHKKRDACKCHKKPHPVNPCKPKECCEKEVTPIPDRVIKTTMAAANATQVADGIIGTATIDLVDAPQFRPCYDPCHQKAVCVNAAITVTGGTQANVIYLTAGVVYNANGDTFPLEPSGQPITVGVGEIKTVYLNQCYKLDDRRTIVVDLEYFSGVSPAGNAAVTYAPVVNPDGTTVPNITTSVYEWDCRPVKCGA